MSIYKITHLKYDNCCYIGSTKQELNKRMWCHKTHALYPEKYKSKLYNIMREEDRKDFIIEELEKINDLSLLKIKEQQYINDLQPTWNTIKSYRTKEQRREYEKIRQRSEKVREYKRNYYIKSIQAK